ncbi:MAG: DUF1501 domain-containing protein, partial [Planctomycetales bacterium]
MRDQSLHRTRRHFFHDCGIGVGKMALASLLAENMSARPTATAAEPASPFAPKKPHFPAKAKRVIYLYQSGAPSQMDLFDPKPQLMNRSGEDLPASIRKGQRLTTMTSGQAKFPVAPSIFKFARHGQSGMVLSELL